LAQAIWHKLWFKLNPSSTTGPHVTFVLELHISAAMSSERVVTFDGLSELVAQGGDLTGVLVAFGSGARQWTPLWAAVVSADEELVAALLSQDGCQRCRGEVNDPDPDSGLLPLHCASKLLMLDSLRALVEAGADVNARSTDMFGLGASGFRLLPECGGQTGLHILCSTRERADSLVACELLIEKRADVHATDNLGLTAHDIAVAHGNVEMQATLAGSGAAPSATTFTKAEMRELCKAREDEWQANQVAQKRTERQQALAWLGSSYHPCRAHCYNPEFLLGCVPQNATVAKELAPGVFCIEEMMPLDTCAALLDELAALGRWADASGFKIARPNSMNRYGMVLNDVGFQETMHSLMQRFVEPIARSVFPSLFKPGDEDSASRSLLSEHSFIVRYKAGEDVDLKTHRDDSDVTLNLCLGQRFEGADVYFHEAPTPCSSCGCGGAPAASGDRPGEYAYPHPADCSFCTFRHRHVPGMAIMHLGKHVHGVETLRSGERVNLIVWCRFRNYPPEMLPC